MTQYKAPFDYKFVETAEWKEQMEIKMVKPRKQTYTMSMYLDNMRDRDIRNDADVQRLFIWSNEQINELIFTVLTEDYIPPVILGEEATSQKWIIDGGQRSSSLMKYRYGNYKITSSIEDSVVSYKAKRRDENGNVIKDENGDIIWEEAEFDIKNKTYGELPDELKKRFNEYQMETIIHEACDMKRISKLIKRYNNHTSMNTSQKAFTYIDNFAREIREILDSSFFTDCSDFKEKEKNNGTVERVVMEAVMCMFHLDDWKKQTKQIATYLNKNAGKEEFSGLGRNLHRLEKIITEDIRDIFNSKDSFIWLTLFHRFTDLGLEDDRFAEFLRAFKGGLKDTEVKGKLFDAADKDRGTKDKSVIMTKLDILENLMYHYFDIRNEDTEKGSTLEFVREYVKADATQEDISLYEDMLDDLILNVDNRTKLLDRGNRPSLIGIVGLACERDIDLEGWIVDFFGRNQCYIRNQKDNLAGMTADLESYISHKGEG